MKSNTPKPASLKYSAIKKGASYSFSRAFTNKDILSFAKLTGDYNQLHIDPKQAQKLFKGNIVHGMLAASLFSALVGMYCPGEHCLYLSQEVEFLKPIYPNDKMLVKGTVVRKIDALKMLHIKTEILVGGKTTTRGLAKVKVLE